MSAQYQQTQDAQSGLWKRLNSWWDSGSSGRDQSDDGAHARASDQDDDPSWQWSNTRLQVLDGLFGPGKVMPYPDDYAASLVAEAELDDISRVLVLGCGPGGIAQDFVAASPGTVRALDDRVEMSDVAQDWLQHQPNAVKFDRREYYETDLRPGFASLIVAPEGLTHIQEQRRLFRHMKQILRPDGQIVFDDFFVSGDDPECPEIAIWSALEERPRHLMLREPFRDVIYDIGFDYPEFHDQTDAHIAQIKGAFKRSVEFFKQAGTDAARLQPAFVLEADKWNRRLALLQSGEVRYYRVKIEFFGKSAVV